MNKEELIKFIQSLRIEEIKKVEIIYFKVKDYGFYPNNRKEYKISVGEKSEIN